MANEENGEEFVREVNDETIAAGEHFDPEAHADAQAAATAAGATTAGATIEEFPPSSQMNPYVSAEEQGMEMKPTVVGPPPYGSPDALSTVGRLLPLDQHPLNEENLPEGVESDAVISEDYGAEPEATTEGDAENGVDATAGAKELAEAEGVDLSQVEGTGTDGRITKGDVETYLDSQG